MFEEYDELVHLSRLALSGRRQDVQVFIRRLSRRLQDVKPDVSAKLEALLLQSPTLQSPLRGDGVSAIPVDADSRLQLLRHEYPVEVGSEPIWTPLLSSRLEQIVAERKKQKDLYKVGLTPTKSMLFTGEPGVGKTLAARWIANKLDRALLLLDLSAVMSSFLGRTGANVRYVLDYAKSHECVLFLDEIDAVAKRRDDVSEIGELKRLVTVLLQEIDDWPPTGILIGATNHATLLDPAIWRRFDVVLEFPMPSDEQVAEVVSRTLEPHGISPGYVTAYSVLLRGISFSEIERDLLLALRASVVDSKPMDLVLREMVKIKAENLGRIDRKKLATGLEDAGLSQRQIHKITGVHRDTIRSMSRK